MSFFDTPHFSVMIKTGSLQLVVPKARDYITLLLGSKERYRDFFNKHLGTFFRSTGWIERSAPEISEDGKARNTITQLGLD